jgi:hypothetical protein
MDKHLQDAYLQVVMMPVTNVNYKDLRELGRKNSGEFYFSNVNLP